MHSNHILAREYQKIVEAGCDLTELNGRLGQRVEELVGELDAARMAIVARTEIMHDLEDRLQRGEGVLVFAPQPCGESARIN